MELKDYLQILFSTMRAKEIGVLLDEMYESYVTESNDSPTKISDVHLVKRTIVDILYKLNE